MKLLRQVVARVLNCLRRLRSGLRMLGCRLRYSRRLAFLGRGAYLDSGVTIEMGRPAGHRGISIGENTRVYSGCRLVTDVRGPESGITIGRDCAINYDCYIVGNGGVHIGDDVIVGPGVQILSAGHSFSDATRAIRLQPSVMGPVRIEGDAWIGGGAIILQGVTIGRHSVVGAGAVVTRDVPCESVAVGNPACVRPSAAR